MLVFGINYVKGISKKTNDPYEAYVLQGLVRRFNGDIQADSAWINPNEYKRSGVVVGDIVLVSKDGEVIVRDHHSEVVDPVLKII